MLTARPMYPSTPRRTPKVYRPATSHTADPVFLATQAIADACQADAESYPGFSGLIVANTRFCWVHGGDPRDVSSFDLRTIGEFAAMKFGSSGRLRKVGVVGGEGGGTGYSVWAVLRGV